MIFLHATDPHAKRWFRRIRRDDGPEESGEWGGDIDPRDDGLADAVVALVRNHGIEDLEAGDVVIDDLWGTWMAEGNTAR